MLFQVKSGKNYKAEIMEKICRSQLPDSSSSPPMRYFSFSLFKNYNIYSRVTFTHKQRFFRLQRHFREEFIADLRKLLLYFVNSSVAYWVIIILMKIWCQTCHPVYLLVVNIWYQLIISIILARPSAFQHQIHEIHAM